ncbi:Reverse transcriptase (RNA-dependent DNA polymerase), partial [Pristimantis euphronides]
AWVKEVVSVGYSLEFWTHPPPCFFQSVPPVASAKASALFKAVDALLLRRVIVPVPQHDQFRGLYSNLFVIPKKDGSIRPILDLRDLNRYVKVRLFQMESLRLVIAWLEKGDFLSSVDIRDAYLHVPINTTHQHFLRFAILEHHFQFVALPFGLATVPRVFTKVLAPVMGLSVRVQSDNATAVAYINHHGGTRSAAAMGEVSRILRWAEGHVLVLSTVYIPGMENWEADFLSRTAVDPGEWSFNL